MKILDGSSNYTKGTCAADALTGTNNNDTLIGGKGNDTLSGLSGQDIYYYRLGDGNDSLVSNYQVEDTIALGAGISVSNLSISIIGNDKRLNFSDGGSITIQNSAFADGNNPKIQFADGSQYQIQGLSLNQISAANPNNVFWVSDDSIDGTANIATKQTHTAFNIEFDYRYDVNHFFDDPIKREALEYSAKLWENQITSDFTDIAAGSLLSVINPNTGQTEQVSLNREIDDIIIFVGAINLDSSSWFGGPATALATSDPTLTYPGRINNIADYQPAAGTITFNINPTWTNGGQRQWFFDPTPAEQDDVPADINTADFVLVAAHEIGHILGIGSGSQAYTNKIVNSKFFGAESVALNGDGVPIQPGGHIADNYTYNNAVPLLAAGGTTIRQPSEIDYSILSGIGYSIDYGEEINLANSSLNAVEGTIGDDIIRGNSLNNTLYGLAGSDQLWGGSSGDDVLVGGGGSNVYCWDKFDGKDTVGSTSRNDLALFYGFAFEERSGHINTNGDLVFYYKNNPEQTFTVAGWNIQPTNARLQSFAFNQNGTMKAFAWNNNADIDVSLSDAAYQSNGITQLECVDSSNAILRGAAAADIITGGAGNDQLWGGSGGIDSLIGGAGADTFWFCENDSNDIIVDFDPMQDKLMFYSDNLTPANVAIQKVNNDLMITIGSSILEVKNGFEMVNVASTVLFANGNQYQVKSNNGSYFLV